MDRRTITLAATVAALCLVIGAWATWSPRLALRSMTSAAMRGDADALRRMVDETAVRRSVEQQIAPGMALAASDAAARKGVRLRGQDARRIHGYAVSMTAGLDVARMAAGMVATPDGLPRPLEARRTSLRTFEAGPAGTHGGMQFELRGIRWILVGTTPLSR